MKSFLFIVAVMLLHAAPAHAQGNWPYHAAGADSGGDCDCQCYRLGLELGTTVLSSWNQAETFTPPVPGSPLYLFETRNTGTSPGLGLYAGLDIDLRLGPSWRLHLRGGYAHDRVVAADNQADVDVTTSTGTPVLGGVQQSGGHGTVDYIETSVIAEWAPASAMFLGGQASVFGGMGLRSRASELNWEWDEEIVNPAAATFLGSVSRTRTQRLALANVGRVRWGPMLGAAVRWELAHGITLPVGIYLSYWLPKVATDETVTDASRSLTSGSVSTVRLTGRDLQNWVSIRAGIAFDL
jgi:hypothetical protein